MANRKAAINDSEWDLLDALWELERGTASEVAKALHPRRGWARTTVKTLLDRMVDKGLVATHRVGSAVHYSPAVAPDAARRTAWQRFVRAAFGGAVSPALEFIARDARLTRRDRAALRQLLEEVDND